MKKRIAWNKGLKGWTNSGSFKKGHSAVAWNKGKKLSPRTEEWKKKVSEIHKKSGLTPPNWKGKKRSPESVEKSAKWRRGRHIPQNMGKNNCLWKGGITPLHIAIRTSLENKAWIRKVFKRDNYTCQECFVRGVYLEAHHKRHFHKILKDFLTEYSQFSPIEDKETLVRLSETYKPFWDLDNGKTLCRECHDHTKKTINGAAAQ